MDNNTIVTEPQTVAGGRGASWLIEGFAFFRQDWLSWIGLAILLIVLTVLFSVIPLANILVPVISPIIVAGLMLACRQQDQGGEIGLGIIFSGFSERPGQLALIGIAHLVAGIAIIILMAILVIIILGGLDSLSQLRIDNPELLIKHAVNLLLVTLMGMLLYMPVMMAMWFAPAIVIFQKVTAIEAMLLSFKACLLNVLPFLAYGIVALVFIILGGIPLFLGWLVLIPVLISSLYLSYKDIFAARID